MDTGPKDKPFEAHITYDAKDHLAVKEFAAADNGWSYSELLGDPAFDDPNFPVTYQAKRSYLTAYGDDSVELNARMAKAVCSVKAPPLRMKIEVIVFDTKSDRPQGGMR